jgi:hypothetical protein
MPSAIVGSAICSYQCWVSWLRTWASDWRLDLPTAPQSSGGWAWLVRDHGGKLQVVSSANQDNPMGQGFYPIMGNDSLGARLLPEIPEPPRRLPQRMVERRQLGGSQQALPGEREVERPAVTNAKGCGDRTLFCFEFPVANGEGSRGHGTHVAHVRATPMRKTVPSP